MASNSVNSGIVSKKIVICGNYGATNVGDEAILDGILDLIGSAYPDAEITVLSSNPEATKKQHNVASVFMVPAGIRSLLNGILHGTLKETLRTIKNSDVFFLGGGGLFTDEKLKAVVIWFLQGITAIWYKKRLFMIGQSVGPLRSWIGQKLTSYIFQRASVVTVRDSFSAGVLRDLNVPTPHVLADPAFAVHTDIVPTLKREKFVVWTARPWSLKVSDVGGSVSGSSKVPKIGSSEKQYADCARLVDWLFEVHGLKSVFVPFQVHQDKDAVVLKTIFDMVKNPEAVEMYEYTDELHEILELFSKATAVVGMRLHSFIFSIMAHTPLLALSYSSKVKGLLDDAGMSDYILPWGQASFSDLKLRFEKLLLNHDALVDRLGEAHILMTSNARKHEEIVREFLNQ
jgi:polysaccharide pyruvyl transferase CsaB